MSFWNKVSKAVVTVVDAVPVILGALQQEGAKKADSRVKEYERQVNNAANSSKMNNSQYAQKVQTERKKIEDTKNRIDDLRNK